MSITSSTIARTIILALALLNQLLHVFGHSPLPIEDETITSIITGCFTVVAAIIAWWKNNSFTRHAIAGDAAMVKSKNS